MFCIGITEFLQSCFFSVTDSFKRKFVLLKFTFSFNIFVLLMYTYQVWGGWSAEKKKGFFQKEWTRCFVGLGKYVKAENKMYRKGEVGGGYLFSLELVQLSLVLSNTFLFLNAVCIFPTPLLTPPTQPPPSYTMMWPLLVHSSMGLDFCHWVIGLPVFVTWRGQNFLSFCLNLAEIYQSLSKCRTFYADNFFNCFAVC